jgi:regulatory protein
MFNDTGDQPVAPTSSEPYQIALRILARRDHACAELQRKLAEKGYNKENIEVVLQKLLEQNLLNDARFAESFVRSRIAKGYGPIRIAAELTQRGVNEELIAQHVNTFADVWLERAHDLQQKRFGKRPAKDFAERAKEMRFLQYRGFTVEQIRKIYRD